MSNPYADDPTVAAEYIGGGRWRQKGATYTTTSVADAQQRLADAVQRIEARRELSDQAKRVAIARAYREARDHITAAGQQAIEQIETQRRTLTRRAFGQEGTADPTAAISRRDADTRAAQLEKPAEAARLLARAERNGDEHLARAIAAHAAELGWSDVLGEYVGSRPDTADTITQLRQLPDTSDPSFKLQHAMTYSVAQPPQLGGMHDYSIDALADSDMDVP
ncbi:hypothetical protein [Streptomyces albus]|uniref:hypothetical protein n=1 Tax=Streptomyces albus TaxID=1888 RepID=UPI0004C70900|nr:hypothetical protein [Streptomyces albus]